MQTYFHPTTQKNLPKTPQKTNKHKPTKEVDQALSDLSLLLKSMEKKLFFFKPSMKVIPGHTNQIMTY